METKKIEAILANNPNGYVDYWIYANKLTYIKSSIWERDGKEVRTNELKLQLYIDNHNDVVSVKAQMKAADKTTMKEYKRELPPVFKKDLLLAALDLRIVEEMNRKLHEIKITLKYDPKVDPAFFGIRTFVENLTTQDVELGIAVLKHFVWQVKRKLFGKKVIHHLSPVITGQQGNGKTENIVRFLKPMEHYKIDLQDALQLTDERRFFSYDENFVATLDELSKIGQADFNKVKNFITSSFLTPRVLGTHSTPQIKQNVTIIGSSNFPLNEQIFDTSGMRRFYEIRVNREISQAISEGINYLAVWKSIDEEGPSPIISFLDQLAQHQEAMRTKDTFELFFEEFRIDPTKPLNYRVLIRDVMYKKFKEWAKESGNDGQWMRDQVLKTRLENKGIRQKTVNGTNYYYVNEDCLLNPDYVATIASTLETDVNIEEVESIPVLESALKKAVEQQNYEQAAQIDRRVKMLKHKNGVNGMLLGL